MNDWSFIGNISSAIAAGLAACSIWITCKEYKRIHRREDDMLALQQQILWYNKVALEDIVTQLNAFIENSGKTIKDLANKKEYLEEDFKNAYYSIKEDCKALQDISYILEIFSVSLYREANDNLEKILDMYSDILNEGRKRKRIYSYTDKGIHKLKVEIIKNLYQYGDKMIDEKIKSPAAD